MFKRKQREVSDGSKHWYQDKYQHVLVQRNVLALIAVVSLITALFAVFAVMRLSPLKTVEPYLLQIDEKTGITQKVEPISRNEYVAFAAVDRYFVSTYIRVRESYNFSVLRYNYNIVRVMSTPDVFYNFRRQVDPGNENSLAARLSNTGQRDIKIKSMSYIQNPPVANQQEEVTPQKIMQVRLMTTDVMPNTADSVQHWVITITFEYAVINLTEEEQLLNPLGFTVVNYQIQRELN